MNYMRELRRFGDYLESRVSPGTLKVYIYALRKWFSTLDGNEPSQETAQHYVDILSKTKSASTAGLHGHAIMRWFRWKGNRIDLDLPTIRPPEPNYLTTDQVTRVLLACNTVLEKTLITVLFDTAVRISELLNTELDDINWDYKLLLVTRKGGRKEEVNISDKGLAVFTEWLDVRDSKSKKIFMGLEYWYAWSLIKGVGKRTGIPIHPHIFRHSRAIHMLMNHAELHTVQQHLGHKSIATTANLYGRFKAIHLKELVPTW